MAFPYTEINAYTERFLVPKVVDNIYQSNKLFNRLLKMGRIKVDGGTQIEQPIEFAKADATAYDGAYDTVSTTYKKTTDLAVLSWKHYVSNTTITDDDEVKNSGKEKVIDYVASKVEGMSKKLKDLLGADLYADSADADETLNGLRQLVDTGNTYAGIAQGTYSWWQAAGEDSSTTALTLAALQTAYGTCENTSNETPTDVVTTQAEFNAYWNLVQPQQRFEAVGDQANVGWRSMLFNGIPLYPDSKCPSGHLFMLNLNHIKLWVSDKFNFKFVPFMTSLNQPAAHVAFLKFAGNILCDSPRTAYKFRALAD